jgi:Protein of unknown function DUF262
MQARETQLLTLLAGQHQFVIPIFQRDYSWGGDECKRLVDDVLAVADGPDGAIHFLGSVVWVGSDSGDAVLQQRLVIDGQQRLTTCLLLLMALRDHLKQGGLPVAPADSPDALHNQYLVNPYVDRPELRSKLQLRRVDNEWLQHVLLNAPAPKDQQSQGPPNLAYLRGLIAEADANRVLKGIRRLMIISVALSPGQDNPQLIFESLNSTGVKLAQADLVRNYVLMGHPEQPSRRKSCWHASEVNCRRLRWTSERARVVRSSSTTPSSASSCAMTRLTWLRGVSSRSAALAKLPASITFT